MLANTIAPVSNPFPKQYLLWIVWLNRPEQYATLRSSAPPSGVIDNKDVVVKVRFVGLEGRMSLTAEVFAVNIVSIGLGRIAHAADCLLLLG